MQKTHLKNLLISLCAFLLISCSPPPNYSHKNIAEVIEDIAKDEFKIEINAWVTGDTVWVFAPLKFFNEKGELRVNKKGEFDEDIIESIHGIFQSINQAILNVEDPPTFYCFIKSDILRVGEINLLRFDFYEIGFIPDQIEFYLTSLALSEAISTEELEDQIVRFQILSMDSRILKDQQGDYLRKYDIPLPEFVLLLIQQNIIRTFLSEEFKDNFEINELELDYSPQALNINFNIKFKEFEENLPVPLQKIEEITKETVAAYSSFLNIPKAVIRDTFNEKTRIITFASDSKLASDGSILNVKADEAHSLLKLSQASFYTTLAENLRAEGKNLTAAANFCKKALLAFPDYLYALNLLAEIYSQLNQPDQALLFLNEAASKDPHNPRVRFHLGAFYQALGKPKEALKHFEDTALLYPEFPGIFSKLCLAHISLGNPEQAEKYLEKSAEQIQKQEINDSENYRLLGDCYRELKQYQPALNYLNKAKELNPDHLLVYISLGETYRLMGNSSQAINNFQKALTLDSDYGPAHLGLANTYLTLGQLELSITEYERALKSYPGTIEIYTNLAKAHLELGRKKSDSSEYEKAILYLKKASRISPNNFNVYYRLGETYIYLGQDDRAIEYFRQALEIDPKSAESYFSLGLAWLNLGQNQEAKENFLKAHQIFYARKDYINARKAKENMRNIPD